MENENTPEIDIWHVAIPVTNLEKSVSFYSDVIGMQLIGRDEYPSKKQAFVAVKKGGFTIELFEPKASSNKPILRPDHLAFECKDIARLRIKIQKVMGEDAPKVEEFDNGVKYLGLNDPDGVYIEVFQGRSIYEKSISKIT